MGEMHTKYTGKGGASAHKLKFLGVSPYSLSQIQITGKNKFEGMRLIKVAKHRDKTFVIYSVNSISFSSLLVLSKIGFFFFGLLDLPKPGFVNFKVTKTSPGYYCRLMCYVQLTAVAYEIFLDACPAKRRGCGKVIIQKTTGAVPHNSVCE